jgi:hypothetical protein
LALTGMYEESRPYPIANAAPRMKTKVCTFSDVSRCTKLGHDVFRVIAGGLYKVFPNSLKVRI